MRMLPHALSRFQLIVVVCEQYTKVRVAGIIIIGKGKAEFTVDPFSIRSMALGRRNNFDHNLCTSKDVKNLFNL
ncbi:hypothetical protein D3C71_1808130 [compost metagenome]